MSTSKTKAAAAKTATTKKPAIAAGNSDAIALLTKDHREVKKLFSVFQKLADAEAPGEERQKVAIQICEALTAHATVEEEIFYPAVREAAEDATDELDEAEVEHASVKELIAQIQAMDPEDELYNAKVKVLGEYVDHHVQEEEKEMFPKAEKTQLDMDELGSQLQARKEELLSTSEQ